MWWGLNPSAARLRCSSDCVLDRALEGKRKRQALSSPVRNRSNSSLAGERNVLRTNECFLAAFWGSAAEWYGFSSKSAPRLSRRARARLRVGTSALKRGCSISRQNLRISRPTAAGAYNCHRKRAASECSRIRTSSAVARLARRRHARERPDEARARRGKYISIYAERVARARALVVRDAASAAAFETSTANKAFRTTSALNRK